MFKVLNVEHQSCKLVMLGHWNVQAGTFHCHIADRKQVKITSTAKDFLTCPQPSAVKGADRKVLRRHESSLYKRCNGVRTRTPDSRFNSRSLVNNYRSSEIVTLQPSTNQNHIFSG
jgi:hypothetical protein